MFSPCIRKSVHTPRQQPTLFRHIQCRRSSRNDAAERNFFLSCIRKMYVFRIMIPGQQLKSMQLLRVTAHFTSFFHFLSRWEAIVTHRH